MKKFLLSLTALLTMTCAANAQEKEIYVGITSNETTVEGKIDGNYNITINLPEVGNDVIDAGNVNVTVKMNNVSGLGLSGNHEATKTISTGVEGVTTTLSGHLSNLYNFGGANARIIVRSGNVSKAFNYTVERNGTSIIATPNSAAEASAVWQTIAAKVLIGSPEVADSHLTFKSGSYVQVANERLVFDGDADFFKGSWSLDNLVNDVRSAVYLQTVDVEPANSYIAVVVLKAGSAITVGSRVATLTEDCTITIDCSKAYTGTALSNILSNFRNQYDNTVGYDERLTDDQNAQYTAALKKKVAILGLVKIFDQVIGIIDDANDVTVTIQFGEYQRTPAINISTEVANADVEETIENASVAEFNATGLQSLEAANNAIDSYIDIVVTDIKTTDDAITGMTFNVTPMLVKEDNGIITEEEYDTPESALTFRLPVPVATTSTLVKVSHEGEVIGYMPVVTENSQKYVEVKAQNFSLYSYVLMKTTECLFGDANADGDITIGDVTTLVNMLTTPSNRRKIVILEEE